MENVEQTNKTNMRYIILVFIFGFFLRIGSTIFLPKAEIVSGDAVYYNNLAKNLVEKQEYILDKEIAKWPPASDGIERDVYWSVGYPLFLASIYYFAGINNFEVVIFVQSVLSALMILLVYFSGKKLFSEKVAKISAFVTSIYPGFIGYAEQISPQLLISFIIIFVIYLFLYLDKNLIISLFVGLICGYGALVRSEFLPLSVILIGISTFIYYPRIGIKRPLLALACVFLIVSFWAVRNYQNFGKPILTTVHYGDTLWLSTWKEDWQEWQEWDKPPLSTIMAGKKLQLEKAEAFKQAAIINIINYPIENIQMVFKRFFRLFASGHSNSFLIFKNSFLQYLYGHDYFKFFIKLLMLAMNIFIVISAFIGAWIYRKRVTDRCIFLYVIFLFYIALHSLIFSCPRYSIPLMSMVIIFASALWSKIKIPEPWSKIFVRSA